QRRRWRQLYLARPAASLTRQLPNPSSPEPSTPAQPSPFAGPSTPRSSAAGPAAETPDGRSPPASLRASSATVHAANSATAAHPADTLPPSTQRDNHLWPHNINLPQQKLRAGARLHKLRRPIPRWPALHDIRDVNLFALQPHRRNHIIQQLPRLADKRQPLRIFIRAWSLTHKHQRCVRITVCKYDRVPPGIRQRTPRAVADLRPQGFQCRRALTRRHNLRRQRRQRIKRIWFWHRCLQFLRERLEITSRRLRLHARLRNLLLNRLHRSHRLHR